MVTDHRPVLEGTLQSKPHIAFRGGVPYVLCSGVDHLNVRAMVWCVQRGHEDDLPAIDLGEIDAELDAEGVAPPALVPVRAEGRDGLTGTQTAVLDLIREAGSITPSELSARLKLHPMARQRALRVLAGRGLVAVEGATTSRVYRAVKQQLRPLTRIAPSRNGKPQPTVEGRVLAAVLGQPGTLAVIASRLDLAVDSVAAAMGKLEREGEVKVNGATWCRA